MSDRLCLQADEIDRRLYQIRETREELKREEARLVLRRQALYTQLEAERDS